MVFAGVIGSLSMVALLSSVIVSLLCLRMRRLKDSEASVDHIGSTNTISKEFRSRNSNFHPGSGTNSVASMDTLRSRVSMKSEYVHSAQARIP
jgi:hypothetical protein